MEREMMGCHERPNAGLFCGGSFESVSKYETMGASKYETMGASKYETMGVSKYETMGASKYEARSASKYGAMGVSNFETLGASKYEARSVRKYATMGVGKYAAIHERRDAELYHRYRQLLARAEVIRMGEILRRLVNSPCSRFWVSGKRAAFVISQLDRGGNLEGMTNNRKRMFEEIYRRARYYRTLYPGMTLTDLSERIVEEPAPSYYLTAASAEVILSKIRCKMRTH